MNLEVTVVGNCVQVVMSGSIFAEDAAVMRDTLISNIDAARTDVLLDFSQVDHICNDGIGVLVSLQKRAAAKGGRLAVTNLTGAVKNSFELLRLDRIFELR